MERQLRIGVLAYHGDVIEHIETTKKAANNLQLSVTIIQVRGKKDLSELDALIIPGGESTTLYKLAQRENILADIKQIKNIFGTCAGAILLAKTLNNPAPDQKTLELMDIEVERNAYGHQRESFETAIDTELGTMQAVFIRAPKIKKIGDNVNVLAKLNEEIIACEEIVNEKYYLALSFHPELTTHLFHEYFLRKLLNS